MWEHLATRLCFMPSRPQGHCSHQSLFFGSLKLEDGSQLEEM